jgi:hypothetical protein
MRLPRTHLQREFKNRTKRSADASGRTRIVARKIAQGQQQGHERGSKEFFQSYHPVEEVLFKEGV